MVTWDELLSMGRTCLCFGKWRWLLGSVSGPRETRLSQELPWSPLACARKGSLVSWVVGDSHVWWICEVNAGPSLPSTQTLPTFLAGSSPVSFVPRLNRHQQAA